METILQAVLDVAGVGAAMVFDGAGRLVCHRGHAIYDQALCGQLSGTLAKAIDTIQLEQEDWDSVSARYADGKLLLRSLGVAGGNAHVLAVVADATLNPSFATVAIRVAANKLRKVLTGAPGSSSMLGGSALSGSVAVAASSVHAPPPLPMGSGVIPLTGSGLLPPATAGSRPGDSRLANSGLSWSQASSVGLSRVAVADAASSTFLSRTAKELARHVGPMAKVYVEEAVRRVSPDAPFSVAVGAKLLEDLAGQIDDERDRARFRQALSLGTGLPPADHPKWIELVTGKNKFKPALLAARMFLASARMEAGKRGVSSDVIRKAAAGLRELYAENAEGANAQQDLAKIFK